MKLVCVHEPQLHSSYGFCKVNSASAKGYNMRRRTAESCTLASAGCNGASGCTVTNGIRCALGFLNKTKSSHQTMQYQDSVLFRVNKKQC